MTNMDPRAELKNTVEKLSELQPGNAALSALKEAIPHLPASKAEAILEILSAQGKDTPTDQPTTAPSTAGVVSRKTQRLIDRVQDCGVDRESRLDAIEQLGKIKDPQAAVTALIVALKDEDPEVRGHAARALGKIKDPQAVPALIDALRDEREYVRGKAAWALGEIKDPRAVPALTQALKEKNSEVRWYAACALQKLRVS